ncbi:MAG: hypothetical protein JXM70_07620 [Pirellulales bacterium]|nr:hypothetical protein [Pirellulales bacterium]
MKFSIIVLLMLSSLGLVQEPTASGPSSVPADAATAPAKTEAVPSQSTPSEALPKQLPPAAAKSPVRTQPFGELFEPKSSEPKPQSSGVEKRINRLRSNVPAQLPRGTVRREIDSNNLKAISPTKSSTTPPVIQPAKSIVPLAATPPELMAAAMNNDDAGSRLNGQSIPLLQMLSFANTPQRQIEVIHAYWHLVSCVARYNLECRLIRRLEDLHGSATKGFSLQTALASASAAREDARCEAIAAQHALAQAAMLGVGDNLPLPDDLPHVGAYRTRFAEIFAAKSAPPRLVLIDRALPIHFKSIEARAQAIAAADNSLQVAMADHAAGQGNIDGIIARLTQFNRQYAALVESVCTYNHEIAEYAVSSLGQPVSNTALVTMLITTKHGGATHFDPRTQPASAISQPGQRPTLAPPRLADRKSVEPRITPPDMRVNPIRPKQQLEPADKAPTQLNPLNPQHKSGVHNGLLLETPKGPTKAPSRLNPPVTPVEGSENTETPRPVVPVRKSDQSSQVPSSNGKWTPVTMHSSHKPAVDQVGHLMKTLYADSNLPADVAGTIGLADYLALGQGMNRRALVEAFWLNRQRAAELQVVMQQNELLDEIRVPGSVLLEAARLATKADMIDAQIRFLESQFDLTNLVGKTVEPLWLTASGAPRSTAYKVSTIATASDTWEFRSRRAMIPAMYRTLCLRANAVIEADASRAEALSGPLDEALACTFKKTEETMEFLALATAYNNAVAGYVLRILPPNVPNRVLAEKLMAGS